MTTFAALAGKEKMTMERVEPLKDLESMVMPDVPAIHLLRAELRDSKDGLEPRRHQPPSLVAPPSVDQFRDIVDAIQWNETPAEDNDPGTVVQLQGVVELETVRGLPKESFKATVSISDSNEDGFRAGQRYEIESANGTSVEGDVAQVYLEKSSDLVFYTKRSITSGEPELCDPLSQTISLATVQEKVPQGGPNATLEYDLIATPESEFPEPVKEALEELRRRVAQPEGFHRYYEGGPHPIVDLEKPFNGKPLKEWLDEIPGVKVSNGMQVVGPEGERHAQESLARSGVTIPAELNERLGELYKTHQVISEEIKKEIPPVIRWSPTEE